MSWGFSLGSRQVWRLQPQRWPSNCWSGKIRPNRKWEVPLRKLVTGSGMASREIGFGVDHGSEDWGRSRDGIGAIGGRLGDQSLQLLIQRFGRCLERGVHLNKHKRRWAHVDDFRSPATLLLRHQNLHGGE